MSQSDLSDSREFPKLAHLLNNLKKKDFVKRFSQNLFWMVILLMQVGASLAQEHNYTQYTIEDGLPTNYVYGVVEDDRGYIWAYTEQGIARFDGYEWKAYDTPDGLATLDCYSMCPLEDGSFLVGGKGWPSILSKDSIYRFPTSDVLDSLDLIKSKIIEGYPPFLSTRMVPNKEYVTHFLITSPDSIKAYPRAFKEIFRGSQSRIIKSKSLKKELNKIISTKYLLDSPSTIYVAQKENVNFGFWGAPEQFLLNGNILGTKRKKLARSFRGVFSNNKFQSLSDSTIHIFNESFSKIILSKNLSSWYNYFDINRVFYAKNGDLWIATRSDGLIKIRRNSQNIRVVEGNQLSVEGVQKHREGIVFADDKSRLYRYQSGKLTDANTEELVKKDSRFQYLRRTEKGELLLKRGETIIRIKKSELAPTSIEEVLWPHSNINNIPDERINSLTNIKLGTIYRGHHKLLSFKDFSIIADPIQIIKINANRDSTYIPIDAKLICDKRPLESNREVFVATKGELLRLTANSVDTVWRSNSMSITALYTLDNKSLLLGTQKNGIYHLSLEKDGIITKILNSKRVVEITKSDFGDFWATTYSGVYRFQQNGEINLHLTVEDGLPSSETYDLDFFSDSVALGTAKGLVVFSQNIQDESANPITIPNKYISIDEVKIRGETYNLESRTIDLYPEQDDIEIDFHLLHPGSEGKIIYEVKLDPFNRTPIQQTTRSIRYPQLGAGNYTFTVTATAHDGSVYTLEQPLDIIVREHLYNRTWFQFLCLIITAGIGWLIYRNRLKQKYKLAAERINNDRRMSELQLEALRSQMNPHFVFNALGSIQYYIQTEEKELADEYLTKFAQLMRKYLDSSKTNLVTIGEELKLLRQYMDLEKMRFDYTFDYHINLASDVDESDLLPSMILQPFVENAIIHGISNRNAPGGEIGIAINIVNESTTIVITDNGIGMQNSKNLKRRGHRSRATEITNQRLAALQNAGNTTITLSYSVPFPNDTKHPGTRAALKIKYLDNEN